MPRRNQRSTTISVNFHYTNFYVSAANVINLSLGPTLYGTSLSSVSDGYDLFRVRALRIRLFSFSTAGAAGITAVGVVPSVPNLIPGTMEANSELLDCIFHAGPAQTTWSDWLRVSPSTLTGPFPWYHTRIGTFDVTECFPATICQFTPQAAGTFITETYGNFEFKDPLPTTSTPAYLSMRVALRAEDQAKAVARARVKLLTILGGLPNA